MKLTEERWLPISDYHFGYFISNFGRVKRVFTRRVRNRVVGFSRILAPKTNGKYHIVKPRQSDKRFYLHRLVAMRFVPVPERYKGMPLDKLEVDHVDGNISNNRADNLRWCLPAENANYPLRRQNISLARRGKAAWNKGLSGFKHKAVILLGVEGGCFESPKQAARVTGVPLANVYASAYHHRATSNGLKFRYVNQ